MEMPYTLFTDASHYAYSRVLNQAVDSPEYLGPIAYTSGSVTNMQQNGLQLKRSFCSLSVWSKIWLILKRSRMYIILQSQTIKAILIEGY